MTFASDETNASAVQKIKRRHELTTWIGAAYAGYVALLATAPGTQLAPVVSALILTLLLGGAGLLGYARVNFEYYVTQLSREIDGGRVEATDPLREAFAQWPQRAENTYRAALTLIVVVGVVLIAGAWQAALECTWPARAILKWHAHCTV
jgi:hypothetical protein